MSWETFFNADLSDDDAAAYGRMLAALHALHDNVAAMSFDRAAVDELTAALGPWTSRLAELTGPETEQANGRVPQLPVRGHAMLPPFRISSAGDGRVDGTVTFGRWFMGGGMAAHGGAVSLLFDEVLGILAALHTKAITRTAYLHTDFRALTPVDVELEVSAWVDRIEGRKIFVRGEVRRGDTLCTEADAMFLMLRPEQGLGKHVTDA